MDHMLPINSGSLFVYAVCPSWIGELFAELNKYYDVSNWSLYVISGHPEYLVQQNSSSKDTHRTIEDCHD